MRLLGCHGSKHQRRDQGVELCGEAGRGRRRGPGGQLAHRDGDPGRVQAQGERQEQEPAEDARAGAPAPRGGDQPQGVETGGQRNDQGKRVVGVEACGPDEHQQLAGEWQPAHPGAGHVLLRHAATLLAQKPPQEQHGQRSFQRHQDVHPGFLAVVDLEGRGRSDEARRESARGVVKAAAQLSRGQDEQHAKDGAQRAQTGFIVSEDARPKVQQPVVEGWVDIVRGVGRDRS